MISLARFYTSTSVVAVKKGNASLSASTSLSLLAMRRMIPPLATINRANPFVKQIEVDVYNFRDLQATGEKMKLCDRIFTSPVRSDIVHKMVVGYLAGLRKGNACTKTRGDVSGGGRKLYAQKGTGRARAGSSRAPHRRGGGIAFGPKPRDYSVDFNRKEVMFACRSVIADKFAADLLKIIDDATIPTDIAKTKHMRELAPFQHKGGTLLIMENPSERFVKASNMLHQQLTCSPIWGTPEFVYLALKRNCLLISKQFFLSRILQIPTASTA